MITYTRTAMFLLSLLLILTACASPKYVMEECHPISREEALSNRQYYKGGIMLCVGSSLYPREAAQQRIGGYAVVEFDVLPNGNTTNISVLESTPNGVFNQVALNAMKKTKFEPSSSGYKKLLYKYSYNMQ